MSAFGYNTMKSNTTNFPQINLTNIKNINNGEQIQVIPSEVIFSDIKVN